MYNVVKRCTNPECDVMLASRKDLGEAMEIACGFKMVDPNPNARFEVYQFGDYTDAKLIGYAKLYHHDDGNSTGFKML